MNKIEDESSKYTYDLIKSVANHLLERTKVRPKIAIICGSGLSALADAIADKEVFEYEKIPNFPLSTVEGHTGCLSFGTLDGVPVMAMQGRFHYYEGYPLQKCSMPVRVMKLLGIEYLLATNAAGGINPAYKIGDIMIIHDHINWLGFAGVSPLRGPNEPRFGPRFPPVTDCYTPELIDKAKAVAKQMGIEKEVHMGVYTCVGGPTYETVAELRLLHKVGADAVGMSTVNEVVTARHCGMKVFAFSLITDKSPLEYQSTDRVNHEEVVNVGKTRQKVCGDLIMGLVHEIAKQ